MKKTTSVTSIKKTKQRSLSDQDIIRIREVAKQHEEDILAALGFDPDRYGNIQQSCPIHGGDNNTAFSYNVRKKCWSCFTNHCEKEFGNDLIGLIRGIKNMSFMDTMAWLKDNFISDNSSIDWQKIDQNICDRQIKDIHWNEYNKPLPEDKIKVLIPDYSSIEDRGFDSDTPKFFECGVSMNSSEEHHRLMLPIRNFKDKLVGFTGRSIYLPCKQCEGYHDSKSNCPDNPYQYSKWRHYPPFFKKNIELYNIQNAKEEIYKTNTAYIVEGPFDVWRLWELGTKNVVAGFGTSLSLAQFSLLAMHGCINIKLLYDPDEGGEHGTEIVENSAREIFNITACKLPVGIGPSKLNKEQYLEIIND